MLSTEFIAGYLSASASFIEYTRGGHTYFAFQIKSTAEDYFLLNQIAVYFELTNKVYVYKQTDRGYSLLIVRNKQVIEKTLIPFFDIYLAGYKRNQFLEWKRSFENVCSTWNYRNVRGPIYPESVRNVDNSPNGV